MSEHPFHQTPEDQKASSEPPKLPGPLAPLLPRFSAFCADMVVVIFLSVTFVSVFLPRFYPEESQAFAEYTEQLSEYRVQASEARESGEEPPPIPEPTPEFEKYRNIQFMVFLTILFLFFFLGEKLSRGSSPGKMLFRLRVVLKDAPEQPLPGIVSALRALVKTSLFIFAPLVVLFALVFFQSQRRGLHDLLARTVLIRAETQPQTPSEDSEPPSDPPLRTP